MFDVAIAGLGPAGRSLAWWCARRGLRVLAVDPRPQAVWRPTYGLWADELGWLPADAVAARVERPAVRASTLHLIEREYLLLDNEAVMRALDLGGVTVRETRLDDSGVLGLRAEARVVVDARGAVPAGEVLDPGAALQTAYGVVVSASDAAAALQGQRAFLMDWGSDWRDPARPDAWDDIPTFLYAMPLGSGGGGDGDGYGDEPRVLLEETCLAAAPALPIDALKARLRRRLFSRGVDATAVDHPVAREIVSIPMRGRDRPVLDGVLAIGAAGRGGHPVTGYSVAHSLRMAESLSARLAAGETPATVDPWTLADIARAAGLRALLGLDREGTLALFDGFGHLTSDQQRHYLSRDCDLGPVLGAMWSMFRAMPPSSKVALARATLGPTRRRRAEPT